MKPLNNESDHYAGYENSNLHGGARLQGKLKATSVECPLVSIVTVVFNGASVIEETILSVLNQSYENVEYIVIDGGSEDGTLDIIKKYEVAIDLWISSPDEGIYDAMNYGASLACGDYINFMNAGDTFYRNQVLTQLAPVFKLQKAIVVGGAEFVYTQSQRVLKRARLREFQMPNCHQACFYRTVDFQRKYYSIDYKILADFKYWFDEFVIDGCDVAIVDEVICSYDMNGISNTLIVDALTEKMRIFNSTSSWKYSILGGVEVGFNFFRLIFARTLQKVGLRSLFVRLKLFFR